MSREAEIYRELQRAARKSAKEGQPASSQDFMIRHLLESFVARLVETRHANDFVLKGGLIIAAYSTRRPTRDVDSNAVSADVTAEKLKQVVRDVAGVEADDGVIFFVDEISTEEIRDSEDYPGFRLKTPAKIFTWNGISAWDISTGDPVIPAPKMVTLPRILGDPIEVLGYGPEMVIAEKAVTILERGVSSTRWRDYVDIVQLFRQGVDTEALFQASDAVARYRGVDLRPVASLLEGYGTLMQDKWAAWRHKHQLQRMSEERLDDQIALVAGFVDPVFGRES